MRVPAALSVLALVLAAAHPGPALAESDQAAKFRDRLVSEATRVTNEALREHCPGRCELLEVRAEVQDGPLVAHVAPGFEELAPDTRAVRARSLDVLLLLDARLPAEFRRDLVTMVRARLRQLPAPATVRADVVAFPKPLPPETPPALADPKPPEPALAKEEEPMPPAAEPPLPPPTLAQRVLDGLVDAFPWLLALSMIAGTLLLAIWLKRRQIPTAGAEPTAGEATSDSTMPPAKAPPLEPVVRRLSAELDESPRLRMAVFRELLLAEGQEDRFARCVQLLGPTIADGLREDPSCRPALQRVGARIRSGLSEPRAEESHRLLRELEVLLTAVRLEGAPGDLEDAFSFLDRLTESQFRQLLEESPPASQSVALRFAPEHLREGALEAMGPARRRALLLDMAESRTPARDEVQRAADELRFLAAQIAPVGDADGTDVLADLLASRDESEQASLLDALAGKPALHRAVLARLCTETTLERVDDDVLAAAASAVPLPELAVYLRAAPPIIRERFLAATTGPLGAALRGEVELQIPAPVTRIAAARRDLLRAVRAVAEQRGLSLQTLNESAPASRRVAG